MKRIEFFNQGEKGYLSRGEESKACAIIRKALVHEGEAIEDADLWH